MPTTKYNVTFHLKTWADSPGEALTNAQTQVAGIQFPPDAALALLPTAGATGAPRTAEGPGWMCVYEIEEAD